MLSAYSTLLLVTVQFLVGCSQQHNLVDRAFLDFFVPKSFVIQDPTTSEQWTRAFNAAVLFFGDTQVITSVAILVSGYVQLPCGLSAYHWQTIVDLAWFSALTHLATLTSLRQYFRSRPTMAILRIIFMGMTLVLLGAALQPTIFMPELRNNESAFVKNVPGLQDSQIVVNEFISSPAICLFSDRSRDKVWKSQSVLEVDGCHRSKPYNPNIVILSLLYLLTSYLSRIIRLFAPLAGSASQWLRYGPISFLQMKYSSTCVHSSMFNPIWTVWKALLLLFMTLWDAFYLAANSMLWEILWLVAALVWGTLRIIGLRMLSHLPGEYSWGFGQILAVLLSTVPIWSFFSTIQEAKYDDVNTGQEIEKKADEHELAETLHSIEQSGWFRSLLGFMFGIAMQFAAEVLYRFPAPGVSDAVFDLSGPELLQSNTKLIVAYYSTMFCFSLLFLIVFASTCLLVHFKHIRPRVFCHHPERWESTKFRNISSRSRLVLVLLLCGLYNLFNYAMFHGPPGQPGIFLKWWSRSHGS
ncbi:MAG: hypothetical protein HETSPECPRED_009818 [Heterodermia speciosa]|uniref:Transmembrane protein n=1 Tax=Heterodermia speciosa TaxID=116794 RepID=A0A8H3G2T2_9LECA|nr:MAG: hypothetical protein HETSPECPRED_009818 [Heterodermia speciosa]